jgi:dienelactone hydrolase
MVALLALAALSSNAQQRGSRRSEQAGVYKDRITPHWFATNSQFWYRNDLPAKSKEFILVNAEKGTRARAFDHEKLAKALSTASGKEFSGAKLPFETIEFIGEGKAVRFEAAEKTWKCDLNSYECTESTAAPTEKEATLRQNADILTSSIAPAANEPEALSPQQRQETGGPSTRRGSGDEQSSSQRSPDEKWTALVKEHNVWLRGAGEEYQLTKDGETDNSYGRLEWSPDSKTFVAWRMVPGERKEVYLVQSSPAGGGRAKLQTRPYALPGDKFTTYELRVFDTGTRQQTRPAVDKFEHEWLRPRLRWSKDRRHFTYQMTDRGHQRFRVIEVDAQSGEARNIIDEQTKTFIWTAHTENVTFPAVNWLEKTDEIIYASESNGWRHLYLIDAKAGALKNPITHGEWIVRGMDSIDETNRQVWFRASGVFPDQDPYLIHYGRVNFDGGGLVWLTEANGNHSIAYSPDRKYVIDTYSRVDLASVNELRRVSDGKLVCKLEEADISELKSSGWEPPEVFVAKGRDGKTDIWGIISRPREFDSGKKYPVIEDIYAGPQGSYVPKTFSSQRRYASLADLGFVVVKIDGMGTANRSKAFHDVCWHNLKDAGFEDRILWMKAAATKYPYMDITRVGVYGTSAGGQNAAGAVLFHPEFYKVAVASCGCHDNRMDKSSWNEQWMGYVPPEKLWSKDSDNWYAQSSNIDNAYRLRGKLMLIVGEMDNNVPPESTYRFVDALIKAGKDFDFIMVPGAGHGTGGAYGVRRRDDYFVRNLLNVAPPDRNGESTQ